MGQTSPNMVFRLAYGCEVNVLKTEETKIDQKSECERVSTEKKKENETEKERCKGKKKRDVTIL